MKKTKRCSECGGTDIRTTTVSSGGWDAPDLLPGAHSWGKAGQLEVYVCMACGHFQYFVPEAWLGAVAASEKFQPFS